MGGLNFPIFKSIRVGKAEFDLAWYWLTNKKDQASQSDACSFFAQTAPSHKGFDFYPSIKMARKRLAVSGAGAQSGKRYSSLQKPKCDIAYFIGIGFTSQNRELTKSIQFN